MRKKRVLLLSEGFGAGHTQAAHALSVSLRKLSPQIQTRVIELGTFLNPTVAPWILAAYRKTVNARPKLMGIMYRYQYKRSLNRLTQLALHRIFYTQTMTIIRQLRPDVIVCTHPIPNAVVSRLQRIGLNQVPLVTLITDYDAHGTWLASEVSKYLISTNEVKEKLLERGIPSSKIQVTGIPVHPNFWEPHNKEEIRTHFGLKDLPTVLIMGGGWGLLHQSKLNEFLTRWRKNVQFIFCLGNNEKVRKQLAAEPRFQHENIHLLGYTNEIDKLMDLSDLLITKPGGMTCTEGLVKGIPMLFYEPLPGQEEENCQYFTSQGYGQPIESLDTIVEWMNRLVKQYPEVNELRRMNQENIARYNPVACAQTIINMLEQSFQTLKK